MTRKRRAISVVLALTTAAINPALCCCLAHGSEPVPVSGEDDRDSSSIVSPDHGSSCCKSKDTAQGGRPWESDGGGSSAIATTVTAPDGEKSNRGHGSDSHDCACGGGARKLAAATDEATAVIGLPGPSIARMMSLLAALPVAWFEVTWGLRLRATGVGWDHGGRAVPMVAGTLRAQHCMMNT